MEQALRARLESVLREQLAADGRILDLENKKIGAAELRWLIDLPDLSALEQLYLGRNDLGDAELRILAEGKWPCLTHLYLHNNKIGDQGGAGIKALAASAFAGNLVCLMLEGNRLGPEAALAIAQAESLRRLEVLFLDSNPIGAEGTRALAKATCLPELRELHLDAAKLGDAGAMALAESASLPGLRKLYLCADGIGDAGMLALARSPVLRNLHTLSVWRNEIRDAGGRVLAAEDPFPLLERLYMSFNHIEKPVRQEIRASALGKRLKTLVMD